jgi:tRNA modification GTPase
MAKSDTIYALSSGRVPAGVAVVRLSGPEAGPTLAALCRVLPEPRRASLRTFRAADGSILDKGLALWLPGPGTETGEDLAELHLHGSAAVIRATFDSLSKRGLRAARAGEFSRRAFGNGKLDLTQLEGLADLVSAETDAQRRQALAQAGGGLRKRAELWREELIRLRAEIEARLDFSDEGDVDDLPAGFWARCESVRQEIAAVVASAKAGERLREGFRVALLGRPNVGKSSLLNALARRDVAIVTPEAGTTRDVLEVPMDLGGYPVVLFDTAGIREAQSAAEQEGVKRARRAGETADLVLWLSDCSSNDEAVAPEPGPEVWRVRSKADLAKPGSRRPALFVSAVTGEGIDELLRGLAVKAETELAGGNSLVARERQREALAAAETALADLSGKPDEVAADLLRSASEAIGRLTGAVDVEEVLDRLFGEFCIGK